MATHAIGATYIATHQGRSWPVVLCDPYATPRPFLESRRNDRHLAAIQLGRYKYIWVSSDGLARYRAERDYLKNEKPSVAMLSQRSSDPEEVLEKQRYTAFHRDAIELRDDKFWQRYITARSEAREVTKEQRRNDQSQRDDSQSEEHMGFDNAHSNGRGAGSDASLHHVHGLEANHSFQPPSGSKSAVHVFAVKENRTDHNLSAGDCFVLFREPGFVKISRVAVSKCEYLRQREHYDEESNRWVIELRHDRRAFDHDLTKSEFERLSVYFVTGDIGPAFLNAGEPKPFGEITEDKKTRYADLLCDAFITSFKIQHEPLEAFLLEKIRGLHPLPNSALLDLAENLGAQVDPDTQPEIYLRDWIVDHMWESWETLKTDNRPQLNRLLATDKWLQQALQQRLYAQTASQKSNSQADDQLSVRDQSSSTEY